MNRFRYTLPTFLAARALSSWAAKAPLTAHGTATPLQPPNA
jgi:hypothetical protein